MHYRMAGHSFGEGAVHERAMVWLIDLEAFGNGVYGIGL